jgi:hypothetical protein
MELSFFYSLVGEKLQSQGGDHGGRYSSIGHEAEPQALKVCKVANKMKKPIETSCFFPNKILNFIKCNQKTKFHFRLQDYLHLYERLRGNKSEFVRTKNCKKKII